MDTDEQVITQQPPRRRLGTAGIVTLAAAVLAIGLGIGYTAFHHSSTPKAATATAAPGTFTLIGGITLPLSDVVAGASAGTCHGNWQGWQDIAPGASVVITDQAGTTIATGVLQEGNGETTASGGTDCRLGFAITGVPDDRTFYGVTVSHRGTVQFSAQQAKSGEVALALDQ